MNKKITALFTGILLFLSFSAQSQITDVPGAVQQPKWFMPIIIEDATQSRDTIYLGIDPEASSLIPDPNFGESFNPISNMSAFRVSVYEFGGQSRKVEILNEETVEFDPTTIEFHNAVYPLKIYWDDITRLHSDSLPFPAPNPDGPRAQLFIDANLAGTSIGNTNYVNCWQAGILISDTLIGEPTVTPVSDTLIINPWVVDSSLNDDVMYFTLTRWSGNCNCFNAIDEMEAKINFSLHPNPASGFVKISLDKKNSAETVLELLDVHGRIIISLQIPIGEDSIQVDLSHYVSGFYYVRVRSDKFISTKKLLNQ